MATTSAAYTPTLNTLITALDPTAQWGNPANRLQIQNASPFTLEITCNGEQNTIQSFTAQTLTLDGAGTTVTMLPTSGPVGAQGSITAVWLQYQQTPPMADGQLTGAAQYAQGLAVPLLPATPFTASGGLVNVPVPVPPTVRTLIVTTASAPGALGLQSLTAVGLVTQQQLYAGPPYLPGEVGTAPTSIFVIPIITPIDTGVGLFFSFFAGGWQGTIEVAGDTAQYPESVLYNGQAGAAVAARTVAGTTTILNGPARILTAEVHSAAAVNAVIVWDGAEILHANATAAQQISSTLTFPPNTLLSHGSSISLTTFGAGAATGTIVSAYP